MKTSDYFDSRSQEWDALYQTDERFARRRKRIESLLRRISLPTHGTALDVGCGTGLFAILLAQMGLQVVGVDISPSMIELAKEQSKKAGGKAEFRVGSIHSIEQSEVYDLVSAFSVLEYVEEDYEAIEILTRSVKAGGFLVISVPNRTGLLRKLEGAIFGIRKASRDRLFGERGEYLTYQRHQYTALELDLLLRQHGFRKRDGIFLNAGFASPAWLARLFENRFWATMYCAAYQRQP